jgi:hypothetical protein
VGAVRCSDLPVRISSDLRYRAAVALPRIPTARPDRRGLVHSRLWRAHRARHDWTRCGTWRRRRPTRPGCGAMGRCTSTKSLHSGDLGGLAGADALCRAELPGSHFYRQSCDGDRGFLGTTNAGFVELELGTCWNCNGWTSNDSGPYVPSMTACPTGYATVGALLPGGCGPAVDRCWRICEAIDHPLICCWP